MVLCNIWGSHLDIEHVPISEYLTRAAPDYMGDGRFVRVEVDPFSSFNQIVCSTPGHLEQSRLNWQHIEALANSRTDLIKTLYSGATRRRILEQYALEQKVSLQLIRRLHRLYLQKGMTEAAVASNLWRCGRIEQPANPGPGDDANPEIRSRQYTKRPGRKPSDGGHYAVPSKLLNRLFAQYVDIYLTSKAGPWAVDVSDELMDEIKRKVKDAKLPATHRKRRKRDGTRTRQTLTRRWPKGAHGRDGKRRRRTMQDMVDHLNYVCRCTREVRDSSGQIIELELAPFNEVTLRQFQHYYHTRVPPAVRKRRHMGDRCYAHTGRPKRGHALQHCVGPGSEYIVDATIADVYLVSVYDRTVVVGRPTVYLAMDLWSRMIVGVHVTFEPPSFEGVALVLENIVTPKDEFCRRYGLTIEPQSWPCRDLPSIGFQADHGSDYLKADGWTAAIKRLHFSMSNVRVGDPTMRALIERRFGIIPVRFQRASYGVVERDATTRGEPRYSWDATDTLSEFTKKLLRAILVYSKTPIGREGAEPDMVFQGMADTPINRWNWGMENRTGSLRTHSIDEVRLATWPHAMAKPTDRGLDWQGVYYTSPYIESTLIHCWGKDAGQEVPIQFHPDDMSQIILVGRDRPEYGYQSGTNKQLPGSVDLLQWKIYQKTDRANARRQKKQMQPERVMESLNNAEESRDSKREQKKALDLAGMKHPETGRIRSARARERQFNKQVPRAVSSGRAGTPMHQEQIAPSPDLGISQDGQPTEAEIGDSLMREMHDMLDA